jgi:hypothetical protein
LDDQNLYLNQNLYLGQNLYIPWPKSVPCEPPRILLFRAAWEAGSARSKPDGCCTCNRWSSVLLGIDCMILPGLPDGLFSNLKSQIWVNFGGPLNGKCFYISWPFGIFYGHLV